MSAIAWAETPTFGLPRQAVAQHAASLGSVRLTVTTWGGRWLPEARIGGGIGDPFEVRVSASSLPASTDLATAKASAEECARAMLAWVGGLRR